MIVVADTSPLTALIQVDAADLLQELFDKISVPEAVRAELLAFHDDIPEWLEVRAVSDRGAVQRLCADIDIGEAEAIALAMELRADLVLIDERKGRSAARSEGVNVIGMLGVVLLAKKRALIPSARVLVEEIEKTAGAYLSRSVKEAALKTVGE